MYVRMQTHGFVFSGHRAFLGFLYLDYCYNNAVVHTFIHLLRGGSGPRVKGTARGSGRRHSLNPRKEDYKINAFTTIKGTLYLSIPTVPTGPLKFTK